MPSPLNTPRPVHYVFIDCENVPYIDLAIIQSPGVTFTLLLGARQTNLDVDIVETLLKNAEAVNLVRLTTTGTNALDFSLVYYLGRAVAADPLGTFHIVSKDKGYDPLIEHLRTRKIKVRRHEQFTSLPFARAPKVVPLLSKPPVAAPLKAEPKSKPRPPLTVEGLQVKVLERLREVSTPRPRRKPGLVSYLINFSGKKFTANEIETLIANLCQANHLAIDDAGRITYQLDLL
jgi:hypothetical protein